MERHNQIKQILRENAPYAYRDDYRPLVNHLSPEEQDKINEAILSIDRLIQLHAQKLELYKEHRKGLIQKLIGVDKFVPGDKLIKPELRFTLDTLNQLDK